MQELGDDDNVGELIAIEVTPERTARAGLGRDQRELLLEVAVPSCDGLVGKQLFRPLAAATSMKKDLAGLRRFGLHDEEVVISVSCGIRDDRELKDGVTADLAIRNTDVVPVRVLVLPGGLGSSEIDLHGRLEG